MTNRRFGRRATVITAVVAAVVLVGGGVAVARVLLAPPATKVALSSASSAGFGAPVEIDLRLTSGDKAMAGTVTVRVGSAEQTVRADAKGEGELTVPADAMTVGAHTVTAVYAGDDNHPAGRGSVTIEVVRATTSLTLTMPTGADGAPLLQAAVQTATGVAAAGQVTFAVGGQAVAGVAVADGQASAPAPGGLALGDHPVTATFTPDHPDQVTTARASTTMSVTKHSATMTAATTAPTVRYGDQATVSVAVQTTGDPVGPVSLMDGATSVATGTTDSSGQASLTFLNGADPGAKAYSVAFGGSGTASAATVPLTIQTTQTNADIVVGQPSTLTPGADAALTVRVVGTPQAPAGTVTVAYDGNQVAAGALDAQGTLPVTVKAVPAGKHTITVTYSGDVRFQPATASAALSAAPPQTNPNTDGAAAINANNPCPATASACVDLSGTVAWLQSGGQVTYGPVKITSGRAGHRTGTGMFAVYWLDKDHKSSIFGDAPMPNSVFFDGGIAFHAGSLSVQSHGCIHLSNAASLAFFDTLAKGDKVYVFGTPPY